MSKVILIVIDGCRPDALKQADTPAIDDLISRGSSTMNALTVEPTITLPAHFSLFTSLPPHDHNVTTNTGNPQPSSTARSLLEVVKYNRLTTTAAYSWELLRNLSPPYALDSSFFLNTDNTEYADADIMRAAIHMLKQQAPDFCFFYLESVDQAGHESGWMSEAYLAATHKADRAIGMLINFLDESGLDEEYTIIVQSDHGGDGYHHLQPVETVIYIPWIVSGKGIRPGHRIDTEVSILDTAPTIARLMGILPHYAWKGRVPDEIFL